MMKIRINALRTGDNIIEEDIHPQDMNVTDIRFKYDAIHMDLTVNKTELQIVCRGMVHFSPYLTCDRCLRDFTPKCEESLGLILTRSRHVETSDDICHWSNELTHIDLTRQILDAIYLSIPQKVLCDENCQGICPNCGADLNTEECSCPEPPVDDRLAPLLQLKSKLSKE